MYGIYVCLVRGWMTSCHFAAVERCAKLYQPAQKFLVHVNGIHAPNATFNSESHLLVFHQVCQLLPVAQRPNARDTEYISGPCRSLAYWHAGTNK
jgi:hypothetical protein